MSETTAACFNLSVTWINFELHRYALLMSSAWRKIVFSEFFSFFDTKRETLENGTEAFLEI